MSSRKMRPEFYTLHAVTLDRAATVEDLTLALQAADAVSERHRLSEGAVYTSACRRYLLATGQDWKAQQQEEGHAVWSESDHRYRIRARDGRSYAQCSCGAEQEVATPEEGDQWHAAHTGRWEVDEHGKRVPAGEPEVQP